METSSIAETPSVVRTGSPDLCRVIRLRCAVLLLIVTIAALSQAQTQQRVKPAGAEPTPNPAVSAILAAFDKYEVVAMPSRCLEEASCVWRALTSL